MFHEIASDNHEADAWETLDALARGPGDQPDVVGIKVDLFAGQAADAVDEQIASHLFGDGRDVFYGIHHAGGGLVLDDGNCLDRRILPQGYCHRFHTKALVPFIGQLRRLNLMGGRHLRDPLGVHAILDDHEATARRHARGDCSLDGRCSRAGHHQRHIFRTVIGRKGSDQFLANTLQEIREFRFSMANIGPHQSLADAL